MSKVSFKETEEIAAKYVVESAAKYAGGEDLAEEEYEQSGGRDDESLDIEEGGGGMGKRR